MIEPRICAVPANDSAGYAAHVSASTPASPFVSRAGLKLDHALREFRIDVSGMVCADFGCNIGGFTDCLLQRGAARVYAIDTGYGTLAWKLRNDPRVIVMERTNALHADVPEPVDLVVIDLAWTPQRHAIPAARRWLKPGGRIISLIKPHYELSDEEKQRLLADGRLDPAEAERVLSRILAGMPGYGVEAAAHTLSPITGGKSSRGKSGSGNIEFLALLHQPSPT
jgi:23S rRNA (cytidine1920-2'-O)/16S rRNA (cytidine1409-2'-O)-methyltransferase